MVWNKALVSILPSPKATKKFRADWSDGTYTDFGAAGYSDFTIHHDKRRRALYRLRHGKDHVTDCYSAGSLSWYILWGQSTDLNCNIMSFKKRFSL